MSGLSRRTLLLGAGAMGSGAASGVLSPVLNLAKAGALATPRGEGSFRIVHATDLHLRSGNGAPEGIALAVKRILSLDPRPKLVLLGGDSVEGLMGAEHGAAELAFNQLAELLKPLDIPTHYAIGNHDVFGWGRVKQATAAEPGYGKSMFAERVLDGPLYSAFALNGWRFIVLDAIQFDASEDRGYVTRIDDAQLLWLQNELAKDAHIPTVVMTHAPLMSGYHSLDTTPYGPFPGKMILTNAKEVNELFKQSNVRLVLQGHTHIRETVDYAGRLHITSGAVCGDWWGGKRFGVDPEGFSVIDLHPDGQVNYAYTPTGWSARK